MMEIYDENEYEECIFQLRILCWKDTKEKSKTIPKPPKSVKTIYKKKTLSKIYAKSNIHFFNMDSIDCAIKFKELNPLTLNLSDDIYAGGYVGSGSGAQEESLFRTTNYCQSLLQSFYPILFNEAVYSSQISVIKTSEATQWKSIPDDKIPKLCFVACPALKYPKTVFNDNNAIELLPEDVEILKNKIRLIIQTAIENEHNTIIFGAMGCGAWCNPVKHVAQIFKCVLDECDGVILNYYFAILNARDDFGTEYKSRRPTVEIFAEVFDYHDQIVSYI